MSPESASEVIPRIVAHRGASAVAAEHTLTAYQRAIDLGADTVECDVRMTADGHLVCVHDSRIDRTSDGRGRVSNKTLYELRERDFGASSPQDHAWLDAADAPDYDEQTRRILTLDRLLEFVLGADRQVDIAIETKHPTRFGGFTEQTLAQTLQRFGLDQAAPDAHWRVWVMSFAAIALRRIRVFAPGIPTVFLMERAPLRSKSGWLPNSASIAGPSIEIIAKDPDLVARWHDAGHKVHVWTVDIEADALLCAKLGVDAVITNRPHDVRQWLTSA
ncbi:MAG: glycerophosphodiester phosphodiesterase family protein [Candidatus Nanopelagicales bacterium]|nr:glycerophosphodiester phosphodiesterase family protein [Candidatus Nanopelagicales bacterium]